MTLAMGIVNRTPDSFYDGGRMDLGESLAAARRHWYRRAPTFSTSAGVIAGAKIVRVHDVRAAVRTVHMTAAVTGARDPIAPLRGLWE